MNAGKGADPVSPVMIQVSKYTNTNTGENTNECRYKYTCRHKYKWVVKRAPMIQVSNLKTRLM